MTGEHLDLYKKKPAAHSILVPKRETLIESNGVNKSFGLSTFGSIAGRKNVGADVVTSTVDIPADKRYNTEQSPSVDKLNIDGTQTEICTNRPSGEGKDSNVERSADGDRTFSAGRSGADPPSTDQPSSDRPSADQSDTHRTDTDRSSSNTPKTDRLLAAKPGTDRLSTHLVDGDRTSSNIYSADMPSTGRSSANRPCADTPKAEKPSTNLPSMDHAGTARSSLDEPSSDRLNTDQPITDKPSPDLRNSDQPITDGQYQPIEDRPTTGRPNGDRVRAEQRNTDSPNAHRSSSGIPSTDSPSTYSPSTDSPSTYSPSTDSPSTDSPSTYSPNADGSNSDQSSDRHSMGKSSAYSDSHKEKSFSADDIPDKLPNAEPSSKSNNPSYTKEPSMATNSLTSSTPCGSDEFNIQAGVYSRKEELFDGKKLSSLTSNTSAVTVPKENCLVQLPSLTRRTSVDNASDIMTSKLSPLSNGIPNDVGHNLNQTQADANNGLTNELLSPKIQYEDTDPTTASNTLQAELDFLFASGSED